MISITESSKYYGENSVLIHYDGRDGEIPSEEEIHKYMLNNYGEKGLVESIEPPNYYKFLYNPGSILVKCKRRNDEMSKR